MDRRVTLPVWASFLARICISAAERPEEVRPVVGPQEHEAIKEYRAYVAAVRSGDAKTILRLAAPISEPCRPIQMAEIKRQIVEEKLRRETAAQMGPISWLTNKDDWGGVGMPSDDDIKEMGVVEHKGGLAELTLKNPAKRTDNLTAGIMVRQNGKWLVPIGKELTVEEERETEVLLVEPKPEEREYYLKRIEALTKGVEAILQRLEMKEFKTRAEVSRALIDARATADRPIDQ